MNAIDVARVLADHHPIDCRACESGEPMEHNYEPPVDQ